MKELTQTVFGEHKGNCFPTCIACLLDCEKDTDVPNFHGADWWGQYQEWLVARGWRLRVWYHNTWGKPKGYSIMSGKSPRGDFLHAVVAYDGELRWDPHPDRTGIETVEDYIVLNNFAMRKGKAK